MSFFTPEEVRKIRLRGAVKIPIADTERTLTVIKMGADHALEMTELRKGGATGALSAEEQRKLFLFMLQKAVVDEKGDLLTESDAQQLLGLLELEEISDLITKVTASLSGTKAGNSKASPGADSSSGSASASAGPTPTT